MKFLSVHFPAFGPFTEFEFDFEEAPGLQVIYGPNESGKSSSLRAFRALLYGIDRQTSDSFLHPYQQLQLRARLQHSDGRILEILRRKRNKESLLDWQDRPLQESELKAFIGNLTEELFDRLYGLDHSRLSTGGKALLQQGGKLGESLFAANVGPALRSLRESLRKEADELWRPRGSNPTVNAAVAEWKKARQRSKECALPVASYQDLMEQRDHKERHSQELSRQLVQARRRLRSLQNQKVALPSWAKLRELQKQLSDYGDLPDLEESFSSRREIAQAKFDKARYEVQRHLEEREKTASQLESLPQEWPLLSIQDSVENLYQGSSQMDALEMRLPQLETQLRLLEQGVERSWRDLGGGPRPLSLESLPHAGLRHEARQLAAEHHALSQERESLTEFRTKLQLKLARLREELELTEVFPDLAELELLLSQARRGASREEQQEALQSELKGQASQLQTALAQLPFWVGKAEELKSLSLPSLERVENYNEQFTEIHHRLRLAEKELANALKQSQSHQKRLSALEMAGPIPSQESLLELRARRKESFLQLLAQWKAGAPPSPDLLRAYSSCVQSADEHSDLIAQNADKVAQRAHLHEQVSRTQKEVQELRGHLQELKQALESLEREWASMWPPSLPQLGPPPEMRRWLERREAILTQLHSRERLKDELHELQLSCTQLLERLEQAFHKAFSQCPPKLDNLSEAFHFMESKIGAARQAKERRAARIQTLADTELELGELEIREKGMEEKHRVWEARWQSLLSHFSSPNPSTPEALVAQLKNYESLQEMLRESEVLSQELAQLQQQKKVFESQLQSVLEVLGNTEWDLSKLSRVTLVQKLYAQVQESRLERRAREELQARLAQTELFLSQNKALQQEAREELEALLLEAGIKDIDLLPQLEKSVHHRRQLLDSIEHLSDHLRELSEGKTIEEFGLTLSQISSQDLEQELEELSQKVEELDCERNDLSTVLGELREKIQSLDGSDRAAQATEEAAQFMAQGLEALQRYLRLELADHLLKVEIENYRSANEKPILDKSSQYFRQLTCGAYTDLRSGYDDKTGEPILEAVAASGRLITVHGMSEGTRDQLFLSLRLATIDLRSQQAESFPLIADDLLVHFDEERARATLQVLATFAENNQVLFFTHLRRDRELAETLEQSPAVKILERLNL